MDEEQVQEPQEQTQVPENEPDNETLTEQPVETTEEQVEAPQEPVQEATVEDAPVEEEDDDSYSPFTGFNEQPYQPPQLDLNQIPQNEDGTLDANALAQQINNQLAAANQEARNARNLVLEMEEKRREESLWHKAQDKYPELKSDKQLASEVQALRMGMLMTDVSGGKNDAKLLSPAQAYERLSKRFATAKAEGVKQATQSVRVQESAYVESPSAGTGQSADKDSLFRQMRSSNRSEAESATNAYLEKLLFGE